jgi:hypothetical protein
LVTSNTPPTAPENLTAQPHGNNSVTLQWNAASDAQTPYETLGYNLVLSTEPNHFNLLAPMADLQSGFRRIVQLPVIRGGDAPVISYTFTNLPPAPNYYWSVQAVDGSYAGSAFSTNATFPIGAPFFSELRLQSGNFNLGFFAPPGVYHVEGVTDLLEPGQSVWSDLGTASTNAPGCFNFTDTQASGYPYRIYRLRSP